MKLYDQINEARLDGHTTFLLDGESVEIDHAAHAVWARQPGDRPCGEWALELHTRWVGEFYARPWARAVREGMISRAQYIATLANLHYYVRHTTRLLGAAIACSPTTLLREHFADHLGGEVNHEQLIEDDLDGLGVSVSWYAGRREADPGARRFADVQFAALYRREPVNFLACPLTAEGVSAAMGAEYIAALRGAALSWGVNPKAATRFLSSHMHFDGGEDGHAAAVEGMILLHVVDEASLRSFLATQRAAQAAFADAFDEALAWI